MEKRAEALQANNYSMLGMRVFRRTDMDVETFCKEEESLLLCILANGINKECESFQRI